MKCLKRSGGAFFRLAVLLFCCVLVQHLMKAEVFDPERAPRPPQSTVETDAAFPGQIFAFVPHSFQLPGQLIVLGGLVLPIGSLPATGVAGQMMVFGNELFGYDATRSKWLTVNRQQIWAGYNGTLTNGYLAPFGGWNTNSTGFYIPRDATLTSFYVVATGRVWRIASAGGDFADIPTALASPSVVNGDTLSLAAETFTTASTITVNKSVLITGADPLLSIVQTAGTGADPVTLMSVTTGGVCLHSFTLKQRKTTNTGAETAVALNAPAGNGIVLNHMRVESMQIGVNITNAPNWSIQRSQLVYAGPAGYTNYLIQVGIHSGTCSITENTFYPSTESTPRTVFCGVTTGNHTGSLELGSNVQSGGNLRQFFVQNDFTGAAGSFALYLASNTYLDNASSGIEFDFSAANQLNLFSAINVTANNCQNGQHKGLVALDGTGAFAGPGTTTWNIANNVIAQPGVTAAGWADATSGAGLIGYNTAVFTPPLVIPYSTVITPPPSAYPNYVVEIRANGLPTAIGTLPVTGFGGYQVARNDDIPAGTILQFYLNGTAINPVIGLEYAYRSCDTCYLA